MFLIVLFELASALRALPHASFAPFHNGDFHGVTRLLLDSFPDGLSKTNDIRHRPVVLLYSHVDNATIVRLAVKCCVDSQSALSELRLEVIRKFNIRPIYVRNFLMTASNT